MNTTLFRAVPRPKDGDEHWQLQKSLTITPRTCSDFGGNGLAEEVEAFVRGDGVFYIPRFFLLDVPSEKHPPTWTVETFHQFLHLHQHPKDDENVHQTAIAQANASTGSTARPITLRLPPRSHQKQAIEDIQRQWDTIGGGLVRAGCGVGKTYMMLASWLKHRSKPSTKLRYGGRLIVMVKGITAQWLECINSYAPEATAMSLHSNKLTKGAWCAHRKELTHRNVDVLVVSLNSAAGSKYMPPARELGFDYLCLDEAHDISAKEMFNATLRCGPAQYITALTATPEKWNGLTPLLYWTFGPMIVYVPRPPPAFKIQASIMQVCHEPGLPNCQRRMFRKEVFDRAGFFSYLADSEDRIAIDLNTILYHRRQYGPTLVFVDRKQKMTTLKAHLQPIAKQLKWKVAFLSGETPQNARLIAKPVDIIVAQFNVGKQANDWPWLCAVIFLDPHNDIIQAAGRGLRAWPNKEMLAITYLCDFEKSGQSTAHQRSVRAAVTQWRYFQRSRIDNDGLEADVVQCVDTRMRPIEQFLPVGISKRGTKRDRPDNTSDTVAEEGGTFGGLLAKRRRLSFIVDGEKEWNEEDDEQHSVEDASEDIQQSSVDPAILSRVFDFIPCNP